MNNLSKKIFALLLVFVHLSSVFGIGVYRCHHAGISKILFLEAAGCDRCGAPDNGAARESTCCAPKVEEHSDCCSTAEKTPGCQLTDSHTDPVDSCCSYSFERLETHSTTPSLTATKVEIGNDGICLFGVIENPSTQTFTPINNTHHYPPESIFGNTLPIYHFCQLRL